MGNNCLSTLCPKFRKSRRRYGEDDRNNSTLWTTGRYAAESPNPGDLVVRSVNFLIDLNSRLHKTDKYFLSRRPINPKLIVRRGQAFEIRITFERRFRYREDALSLVFVVKDETNPTYSNKTEITVPVLDERNARRYSIVSDNKWGARITSIDSNNSIVVEVSSSSEAIIGEYQIVIDTQSPARIDDSFFSNPISQSIIILFNPWNRSDFVYMRDRYAKEEYVLNDQGIIWRGTHEQMKPTHWNFAQFEDKILEACLYTLTNVGKLDPADRNDPIKVCRHIAAIVNSVDDKGVVMGHWDEDFRGGTAPTDWHGSQAILQSFLKTKKPVKYGQCWVFSGVTCTIARCLGIPCRVVTNYMSAHDTHKSITVDRFFDEDGEPIDKLNKDSIWNFHSWDEVWITRPDISSSGAYDGWNVIDATPQESSDGLYRCGPTSVETIKYGDITKPYDGFFVYAEVNADEVYWLHKGDKKPLKLITHSIDTIGVNISTKGILKNSRVDITANYKHKEGSKSERETLLKALRLTKNNFSRYYLNEKFEDIHFDLIPMNDRMIGQPFTVRFSMTNKSNKVYTIELSIGVRSMSYNGIRKSAIKQENIVKTIGPRKNQEVSVLVTFQDYEHHLSAQSIFNISVMANVLESDFQFYVGDDFRLLLPDIKIETEGDIIVGRPFTCHLSFVNPLPKPLTKGIFHVEGPDYTTRVNLPIKQPIQSNEVASTFLLLTPNTEGDRRITAKFKSNELNDVDGTLNIRVDDDYDDNNNINNNRIDTSNRSNDNSGADYDLNNNTIRWSH